MPLGELYQALKTTYCGSIGAEYMHITSTEEKRWLQQRLESVQSRPKFDKNEKLRILKGLTADKPRNFAFIPSSNESNTAVIEHQIVSPPTLGTC